MTFMDSINTIVTDTKLPWFVQIATGNTKYDDNYKFRQGITKRDDYYKLHTP